MDGVAGIVKCDRAVTLGSMIYWQGPDGVTRGPGKVEQLSVFERRTWAFVQYEGVDRWISETIITMVERGDA